MAQKLGKDYLRRSAQGQAMLKKLREKKLQTREKGERVLLHKFIKQVYLITSLPVSRNAN